MKTLILVLAGLLCLPIGYAQKKYKGCPMHGSATNEGDRALNRLKNRYTIPTASDFDQSVTLNKLITKGKNDSSFSTSKAGEIIGFVDTVFKGSIETCNCKKSKLIDRDTHIVLVANPGDPKTKRVIVEVTPRLRRIMKANNLDWTTQTLRTSISKKWVKFKGWLFWDNEHWDESKLSNPSGNNLWRATAWEIHPVTGIEVVPQP